ncbi:FimV/HubP family polar landmark protein [Wenzhouxiangella sp. EGI_FJ10409]|uniref:FimV/HubP family polar landmark protein n=1 Tax=Wenzhouxiangella sp. EGI_FJ10409 TaxID=3243767 RepID=UPI0035DB3BE1
MANTAVRMIAPVLLGALILLFPADGLRALGLGEARVDSWLGQPLDVSIRLLEVESEAIESVSVGPASLEDFERLGVPSESLGLGLEVTVDRSASPPVVRVRSQRPVSDPVVQVLIDARWSSGRVLREYTLFLDPPVRDSAAPAREVSQPASEPAPEPASQPAAEPAERERPARRPAESAASNEPRERPSPSEQPADTASAPASGGADSVAVADGDTLWSIAQNWRPDSSLSMDQVMLAIFNRNRDAFLGENINRLRSGAQLDMPGVDDVRSVDRADAEQRVREHMRSWQPEVAEDVPVVSDAAMPESPSTPSDDDADASAEAETEETDAGEDEDFRLDVVPPEEDQYSESSAVAEGEIQRVGDQLAEVEEAIIAEDLDNPAFDDHVAEVRDALEQRDMAGLAVAEESLAELEARLREAREARAEEERLARSDGGDEATDSEEGDQIADYMSELEEEFGPGEDDSADDSDEATARADGSADDGDEAAGDADDAASDEDPADELAADETADTSEQSSDAAGDQEAEPSMTVTRTSSGGLTAWLWPALGLLLVILLAAAALVWLRRRRAEDGGSELSLGGGDAVDAARAAVARKPHDLGARLALLKLLADEGREQEFTDAFDQMYQEVDDESEPEWQEALSLASVHVPDHPLLTPRETSLDEDDDFDRRADEMFGMLDVDESESEAPAEFDADERGADEEVFDLGMEDDEEAERTTRAESERETSEAGKEDTFDNDMDLAVLSERLDDPSKEPGSDHSLDEDKGDADFGEFKEIDEFSLEDEPDEAGESRDKPSEAPIDLEDETAPEPDLDLDPAREQEADEVFGESGTRDTGDLDLELSSDVEDLESTSDDGGLDFELGAAPATEDEATDSADAEQDSESSEADDAFELSEPETSESESPAAAGGSLSDEDADVKLDLARAYISVDLADSARSVLEEVVSDGSEDKRAEAKKLLDSIV